MTDLTQTNGHNSTPREFTTIGVIGGGAWGTALAIHAARIGHRTLLYAREQQAVDTMNGPTRENLTYLPGVKLPSNLTATTELEATVEEAEILLMVVPTPFVAETLERVAHLLKPDRHILVACSKGILNNTLETVDLILERVLPRSFHTRLVYLSGPSFAAEVAKQIPTAVTIAGKDETVAARAQLLLSSPRFRCYRTTDVVGVELCGALKNVLAIACGISDGLGFGSNARAALITRGLNEITRLAVAKGGHPLTMGGLAGIGDLVLTCTGDLSRNRNVGLRIGKGEKLPDIMASMKAVAEGVLTSKSAYHLAKSMEIETPIIEGIYRVIHEDADPLKVVEEVMSRALRAEVDDTIMSKLLVTPSDAPKHGRRVPLWQAGSWGGCAALVATMLVRALR